MCSRPNEKPPGEGRAQAPRKHSQPTSHQADAANQVWSWDITYLPTQVRGQFYYLYLVEDIFSRKGGGWEIHEQAAALIQRTGHGRAVLWSTLGVALGQRGTDEIGNPADQAV